MKDVPVERAYRPRTTYLGPAGGWLTEHRLAGVLGLEEGSRMAATCAAILDGGYDPELSTAQPAYRCTHGHWQKNRAGALVCGWCGCMCSAVGIADYGVSEHRVAFEAVGGSGRAE